MNIFFCIFLMYSTVFQASSIIHKSIDYIDLESKAACIHADSKLRTVELSKRSSDYWNFLKVEEGDASLFELISQQTIAKGNRNYGLLPEDVGQIQSFLSSYKMFNNSEIFAHPALPAWLEQVYENKQNDLEKKIDFDDQEWQFFKEKNIRMGLVSYVLQNYHQKTCNHKKYFYQKKSVPLGQETEVQEIKKLADIVRYESVNYLYVENVGTDEHENLQHSHLIIPAKDLNTENEVKISDYLVRFLDDNSQATAIIVFDDQDITALNFDSFWRNFNFKKLSITGKSLKKVGYGFLESWTNLKELELSDGIEEIGEEFLADCSGLKKLKIKSLNKVGNYFLEGLINLQELDISVKEAGDYFLADCSGLKKLNIRGLKEIKKGFLHCCTSLETITIEGSKKVGTDFLRSCLHLKELELPDELEETGSLFLEDCNALEKLIMNEELYHKLKKRQLSYLPKNTKIILKNSLSKRRDRS